MENRNTPKRSRKRARVKEVESSTPRSDSARLDMWESHRIALIKSELVLAKREGMKLAARLTQAGADAAQQKTMIATLEEKLDIAEEGRAKLDEDSTKSREENAGLREKLTSLEAANHELRTSLDQKEDESAQIRKLQALDQDLTKALSQQTDLNADLLDEKRATLEPGS